MFGNSNSLGIGRTGHTYNLVPKNMQLSQNNFRARQANQPVGAIPNQPRTQNQHQNQNQPSSRQSQESQPQSQPHPQIDNYHHPSHPENRTNTKKDITSQPLQQPPPPIGNYQAKNNNQPLPGEEVNSNQPMPMDVGASNNGDRETPDGQMDMRYYWNELFKNVCSNQLYGAFRKVKGITNNAKYFDNTRLSYINYEAMQLLISKAKRDRLKKGLMSLKTYLSSPAQEAVDPANLENILNLINIMEIMGPPDHALIALDDDQVNYLKEKEFHEYFWPNGDNGITWITKGSQENWNN